MAADRSAQRKLRIRSARLADLPALAAIERASFPDPWPEEFLRAYLDDPHALALVAEDPQPVGFLIVRDEAAARGGRALHIHDLAVAPPCRRRGVGSALLAELVRVARCRGVARIRLEVRVTNEAARRFYEKHGFQAVRRLARYYGDGGAALQMELDLGRGGATGGAPPSERRQGT